jgi:hypothetical protein
MDAGVQTTSSAIAIVGAALSMISFPVDGVFVADHVAYNSNAGDGQNYDDGEHVTSFDRISYAQAG